MWAGTECHGSTPDHYCTDRRWRLCPRDFGFILVEWEEVEVRRPSWKVMIVCLLQKPVCWSRNHSPPDGGHVVCPQTGLSKALEAAVKVTKCSAILRWRRPSEDLHHLSMSSLDPHVFRRHQCTTRLERSLCTARLLLGLSAMVELRPCLRAGRTTLD